MPMDTTETGRLCLAVERAAADLSASLRLRAEVTKTLDGFWHLQDLVSRLIQGIESANGDVPQCRSVIRKVVDVISCPSAVKLSSIPAIATSCDTLNLSLIILERKTCGVIAPTHARQRKHFQTRRF